MKDIMPSLSDVKHKIYTGKYRIFIEKQDLGRGGFEACPHLGQGTSQKRASLTLETIPQLLKIQIVRIAGHQREYMVSSFPFLVEKLEA